MDSTGYIYLYKNTCTDAITISEKRKGHEFEGEWGGAKRRVWREEREARDVVIKL